MLQTKEKKIESSLFNKFFFKLEILHFQESVKCQISTLLTLGILQEEEILHFKFFFRFRSQTDEQNLINL